MTCLVMGVIIILALQKITYQRIETVSHDQALDSIIVNVHNSMQKAADDQLDSFYYYSGKADAYFEIKKLLK